MSIAQNIEIVKTNIEKACIRCGRSPEEITLIGVTKTHGADIINEGISGGLTHIGENRVQELCEKYETIEKGVHIHLIGHLQSNKVKYIADKVDLIHSLDSKNLAKEISAQAVKHARIIEALVQVNISGEETKSGISPDELDELLEYIELLPGIKIKGFMTIPPVDTGDMLQSRKIFEKLRILFEKTKEKRYNNTVIEHLSMGMTNDYEIAIEEGSTMVRVGRAIFGNR
ncbi:MAG: YggS family pyridoxal phosphate-dependent enzyme [Clostridia bacterium]|nr:YggS family pyridoxal phosphate-dependent enzyme [Clostridia bacterium]